MRGQPFLVEPNPDWPDNVRVDIRDQRWQEMLLREEVAAPDRSAGFDGLMLDTIDTAPYLETKDPARFAGSRQALRDWLRRLREAFPRAVVVANGSDALVDVAPFVDALRGRGRVRDLRRPAGEPTAQTTDAERDWKLARDRARAGGRAAAGVHDRIRRRRRRRAVAAGRTSESVRHGFRPYVGVRDLNTAP